MNTPKKFYTWADVETAANSIAMQMYKDNWRPDYIVGLTRGGLPLAVLLSHKTGIRMETLKVKLRDLTDDEDGCESNLWMAEDAYGYVNEDDYDPMLSKFKAEMESRKNILIVDDINDTGATFEWIKKDWSSGCLPDSPAWQSVWGNNVRFAVMTENLSSEFGEVAYHWDEVNKAEEDVWLVYPYE
jgi:hypoxanthine phosphoribosyltransferase